MLYVLFFLFRDGRSIARNIRASMPLSEEYNRQLIEQVRGGGPRHGERQHRDRGDPGHHRRRRLLGARDQGGAALGALMTFLSLLPAVGSALVWVPAAAYLILIGAWKGLILVLVGVLVIGLIDNLLRPILVGKDTRLPDYVVLVSTLGGISIFGINGFVIGPLIAALFIAAWTLFRDERDALRRTELRGYFIRRCATREADDDHQAVGRLREPRVRGARQKPLRPRRIGAHSRANHDGIASCPPSVVASP